MTLKKPLRPKEKEKPDEEQTLCLSAGEGRYFLIHRLSQIKKRNRRKELRKRMKEIRHLALQPL